MPSTYIDRIDGVSTSVAVKAPVQAVTISALAWPLNGLSTVGGVALAEGDRVLVKNQTDTTQNGIWVASAHAWVRAPDWDGARDAVPGTLVHQAGSTQYYEAQAADNPIKPGTSQVTFIATFTSSGDGTDDDILYPAGTSTVPVPEGKGFVRVDCTLGNRTIIYDAGDTSLRKEVTIQKVGESNILTINDGSIDVYPENTQQRVRWRRSFDTVVEVGRSQ